MRLTPISKVMLTEFYDRLISPLVEARLAKLNEPHSYYILILALVRDADAPTFYSDIERYWNSLDDVTGDRVLFAVAGPDAAAHLGHANVVGDKYSSNIAFAPSSTTVSDPAEVIRRIIRDARTDDTGNFGRIIRDANTSQVSELRRFLKLSETDVPCLHLTLLRSNPKRTIVLRLKDIPDFSIYTVCKDIMSRLQPILDRMEMVESMVPGSRTSAISSLLKKSMDSRLFSTTSMTALDPSSVSMPVSAIEEQRPLDKLLEQKFCDLGTIAQYTRTDRRWDYFISYPQKARDLATEIFKKLDRLMRVFMDYFCLVAGQHWDKVTPEIQAHSGGTIILVTPDTPLAHFQQSEIHLAINLYRTQGHKIIPIYTDAGVPAPFGLQQIHGIVSSPYAQHNIPSLLLDHLKRSGEPFLQSL
jgi:hypothetical protein